MDPLAKLDLAWDTSLCLLRELNLRGHETFLFVPEFLSLEAGRVAGKGRQILPLGGNRYREETFGKFDLAGFDAVLIRKDPPFDSNYLTLTYLLEPLARKTLVVNHPRGIRNANEKLFGLSASRGSPSTLVSSQLEEILAFQRKIKTDLVIKPLYEKGGKGVFKWKCGENQRRLAQATRGGKVWVVAQKFIPVARGSGDKRILLWRGEILGAFERIPRAGEFRSNLSLGGKFMKCGITGKEKQLVKNFRPVLLKEGLLFVGIDVRSERLIEVNVTSPAGLVELDLLYGGATRKIAGYLGSK